MSGLFNRATQRALLAEPELLAALSRFVRARVPGSDVDDIVQTVLTEALASPRTPEERVELQRFVFGIAKNKVADFFRHARRHSAQGVGVEAAVAAESGPLSARDLLRWAEKELPLGTQSENTLEWLLREGSGDKLEEIAADARVPAPRVRQRVARLRRHFRERWAVELTSVVALLLIATGVWIWQSREHKPLETIVERETPHMTANEDRALKLRHSAFQACDKGAFRNCIEQLDSAKLLDAMGDRAPRVQNARRMAKVGLERDVPQVLPDATEKRAPVAPDAKTKHIAPAPKRNNAGKTPLRLPPKADKKSTETQFYRDNSLEQAPTDSVQQRPLKAPIPPRK